MVIKTSVGKKVQLPRKGKSYRGHLKFKVVLNFQHYVPSSVFKSTEIWDLTTDFRNNLTAASNKNKVIYFSVVNNEFIIILDALPPNVSFCTTEAL